MLIIPPMKSVKRSLLIGRSSRVESIVGQDKQGFRCVNGKGETLNAYRSRAQCRREFLRARKARSVKLYQIRSVSKVILNDLWIMKANPKLIGYLSVTLF